MLDHLANLRISVKVLVAPLLLIVSMLILAVIFQLGIQREGAALTKLHDESFHRAAAVADLKSSSATVQANLYRVLGWQSSGIDKPKIAALEKDIRGQLKALTDKASALANPDLTAKATALTGAAGEVLDM